MSDDSVTVWLAIYGAVASTLGGIWQFYQWWKSGPQLSLKATKNMQMASGGRIDDKQYIVLNVSNRGSSATTITHLAIYIYDSWLDRVLRKRSKAAVVDQDTLPAVLEPGKQWTGLCHQSEEVNNWLKSKRVYLVILHSASDKEVMVRCGKK